MGDEGEQGRLPPSDDQLSQARAAGRIFADRVGDLLREGQAGDLGEAASLAAHQLLPPKAVEGMPVTVYSLAVYDRAWKRECFENQLAAFLALYPDHARVVFIGRLGLREFWAELEPQPPSRPAAMALAEYLTACGYDVRLIPSEAVPAAAQPQEKRDISDEELLAPNPVPEDDPFFQQGARIATGSQIRIARGPMPSKTSDESHSR